MRIEAGWMVVAVLLTACTGADPGDGSELGEETVYRPFDEARLELQGARLGSHSTIVALRDEASLETAGEVFPAMDAAYRSNGLADAVAAVVDGHDVGLVHAGSFLDAHIVEALALGLDAETETEVTWAGEVVDKALLGFFSIAVYDALQARERAALDDAFGLFGLTPEGEVVGGLARVAAGREAEFGVSINNRVMSAFLDARAALEAGTAGAGESLGDDPDFEAAELAIDRQLRATMLFYTLHEVHEIEEEPEEAATKVLESRVLWEVLRPWGASVDAAASARIDAALWGDARPDVEAAGFFLTGLDAIEAGDRTVDAHALAGDLGLLLDALEI